MLPFQYKGAKRARQMHTATSLFDPRSGSRTRVFLVFPVIPPDPAMAVYFLDLKAHDLWFDGLEAPIANAVTATLAAGGRSLQPAGGTDLLLIRPLYSEHRSGPTLAS